MADRCRFGGQTKENGNCTILAPDDGFAVQCVGPWSKTKHDILSRYLSASGGPRRKYLPPAPGGAAFVDLFAGPGRARVRTTGELDDGSPLIALRQPIGFTRIVLCELDSENANALRHRTGAARVAVSIVEGDCNKKISEVITDIPVWGLNVALIDPNRLADLHFETIAHLAGFKRMDLIVFFPIGEIKRNLERNRSTYAAYINRALGTEDWQQAVKGKRDVTRLIGIFQQQLRRRFGYTAGQIRTAPIMNDKNVPLYHLVFASKHTRGDAIWESITSAGWLF